MKLLFVNACVRKESRTLSLCNAYLNHLEQTGEWEIQELDLQKEALMPFNLAMLEQRDQDIAAGMLDAEKYQYAKDFAAADRILIGAPYWDNSFPASLKVYLEHICVNTVTFAYAEDGTPIPLCHADTLVYVTTAGGYIGKRSSGEMYWQDMCEMFGIPEFQSYRAEGLDIVGSDIEKILEETKHSLCEPKP